MHQYSSHVMCRRLHLLHSVHSDRHSFQSQKLCTRAVTLFAPCNSIQPELIPTHSADQSSAFAVVTRFTSRSFVLCSLIDEFALSHRTREQLSLFAQVSQLIFDPVMPEPQANQSVCYCKRLLSARTMSVFQRASPCSLFIARIMGSCSFNFFSRMRSAIS